ncbi:MAG: serine hydrolase domain-containing protein [Myxococcota bacterium]
MGDDDERGGVKAALNEAVIDARFGQALDAWRELGPEDDLGTDFIDRVMKAEEARARPRVVALSDDDAPMAVAQRPSSRRWRWGLAAASIAGLLTLGLRPWSGDSLPGALVEADAPSTAEAVAGVGDGFEVPELTAEGVPGQPLPPDFGTSIESYIEEYGRNYGPAFKFHGVVLVARRGEVLYQRGFGLADAIEGTPNTIHTRFRLGLLTEPFTALAILQLRDQGKLSLRDTLDELVPELPRGGHITIADLLSHRSGIPNYTDLPEFSEWKSKPTDSVTMLERIAALPLQFAPGSATAPSNSNYYLLGLIIERVTGDTYAEFMQRSVFEPAAMGDSSFGDAWDSGEQARGNVWNEGEFLEPPEPIDMSNFGAAGGLVASPADMVAWDRALSAGTLLSGESLDEMGTPSEDGYGYGWVVSRAYGQRLLSFPGAIDGYSGSVLRFQEDGTLVVVLANTEVVPGAQVAQDVAMMVHGDQPAVRNEPAEISVAPGTYARYVGTYGISQQTREALADSVPAGGFAPFETVHVEQEDDRLYFNLPGHARTWMHPMGRHRFFFKDHSGNKVSFELDGGTQAARMTVHYPGVQLVLDRKPSG